jgi:OCT family organic cation transporter-like MFS transporter 4/5
MAKNKNNAAYKIFKKIAVSNKKDLNNLTQLELIKENNNPMKLLNNTHEKYDEQNQVAPISFKATFKLFFKSRKLLIRSAVILLNWLTNTLVYYGISFNTGDLVGDPYRNFFLSIFVEFVAILTCQLTLERYGRKIPYSINMAIAGTTLLCVQFVPTNLPHLVTVLALCAKFSISFTYNSIYIITAELHPTVIRNTSLSICQTFSRFGGVIAPNIQLLGEMYWFPIPFIIYGTFSAISAFTFMIVMPETKNLKLPDTIEDFI